MSIQQQPDLPDEPRLIWAPMHPGQWIRGAWWPRSRNITVELQSFLPAADSYLGAPLKRLSLNPEAWDEQPLRLQIDGRMIRLAWFAMLDPATVGIGATALTRVTLLVIPPDCDAAVGLRIFHRLEGMPIWPTETAQLLTIGADRGRGLA